MKSTDIHIGGVYKVKALDAVREVKVVSATVKGVRVAFGRWDNKSQSFLKRTIIRGENDRVSEMTIAPTAFVELVHKGVVMAKKKDDVEPILKPSQKKAASAKGAASKKDKVEAIKSTRKSAASKKKTLTAEQKEKAKAKKLAEKMAKKLSDVLAKTDLKQAAVAEQFSAGRTKKFVDLTSDESEKALAHLKEAASNKRKETALATKRALTDEEAATRRQMENQVRKNLTQLESATMEIGSALTVINDNRLYRSTHNTFREYVTEVFDLSQPQAYSVMNAANTFRMIIGEDTKVDIKSLPSIRAAEAITRSTQRLLKAGGFAGSDDEKAITTQIARNIYNLAVDTAPKNKAGKPILSPAHLDSVAVVLNDIAKSGAVEVDGKQVPLSIAKAAIGEQIAEQSVERQKRLNAYLAERVQSKADEFRSSFDQSNAKAGTGRLDAALNAATSDDLSIPEGVTPRLTMNCSVHGRSTNDVDMTEQYLKLNCGCKFLMTPEGLKFGEQVKPKKKAAPKADKPAEAQAQA